mmetsp:Transcript_17808/g.30697  ORF Transcript_17808/g.30697 Transcript_17808/m.30697 type:complete len:170 (-) Transcript_17808:476-985(-)
MTRVFFQRTRYVSSHRHACRSRWFVGSSRRRTSGSQKRARARAILMRQPPEKSEQRLRCMGAVNCRPARMDDARDSAESAPISVSRLYTSFSRSAAASSGLTALPFSGGSDLVTVAACLEAEAAAVALPLLPKISRSFFSSARSADRSTSHASTHSSAVSSLPATSCSM